MKSDSIYITATKNGYVLNNRHTSGGYGENTNCWVFESMEELQRSLPGILNIPLDQRDKDCGCGKGIAV